MGRREAKTYSRSVGASFGVLIIAAALVLIVFLWSPIPDLIASAGNTTFG